MSHGSVIHVTLRANAKGSFGPCVTSHHSCTNTLHIPTHTCTHITHAQTHYTYPHILVHTSTCTHIHFMAQVSKQRDRVTGLSTIQYKINSVVQLTIDGTPVNFVSVELQCDYERTPFCDNPV